MKKAEEIECSKCEEYKTQLEAWFSIFGTNQLTHAQARLEQAEKLNTWIKENECEIIDMQTGLRHRVVKLKAKEQEYENF